MLQFQNSEALAGLHRAWKSSREDRLSVVYFGDSHVQGGTYLRGVRRGLSEYHESSGMGLMFPYSAAKFRSPVDYKTEHTGEWECASVRRIPPAIPVSVAGVACRSVDKDASVTMKMRTRPSGSWDLLRIFVQRHAEPYSLDLTVDGKHYPLIVARASDEETPYVEVEIEPLRESISLSRDPATSDDAPLEIYGLMLTDRADHGFVVHNAGVGAARYRAVNYQALTSDHLPHFDADVVVLDYGTNDILYTDTIDPRLETTIREAIAKVRLAAPEATIILTSARDLALRGEHITSGGAFSNLVKRIAFSEGCAFWDWFQVAGGPMSVTSWREEGLAQRDLIHLNTKGYRLKAKAFVSALKSAIDTMDRMNADARTASYATPSAFMSIDTRTPAPLFKAR